MENIGVVWDKRKRKLREWLLSWRPFWQDVKEDYHDLYRELSNYGRQHPRLMRQIGWASLLGVSILVGFGTKTWAEDAVTLGQEDYRLLAASKLYSLNELRQQALNQGASLVAPEPVHYPACQSSSDVSGQD